MPDDILIAMRTFQSIGNCSATTITIIAYNFRALMPMHIAIWEESIVPFSKLNVTFEEFCLLKALTVWQASELFFHVSEIA